MTKEHKDSKIEEIYEFDGTGLDVGEKRIGRKLFSDYQEHYHISTLSDLQLLEELCFREVLQRSNKKIREEQQKSDVEDKRLPKTYFANLNNNLEQILILREKLGLFEDKKADDPYKYIQRLKEKFKKWGDENSESRTFPCPHCKQAIMLKIRMTEWEAMKHPYFKGRYLANDQLWKMVREGKLSKEDVAKILDVSPDYVDFIEDKLYQRPTDSSSE